MNAAVVQSREVQTEMREGSWTEKRNNSLLQKWLLLVKGPQLRFPHIQGSSCSRADCPKPGKSLDFGHGLTPVLTYGQVLFTEAETLEEVNHQHWQIILQITARYGIVTPCWHVRVCTVWWVKPMFTTQTTFMVSECVFVCVCFSSAGKKAAIFIYVNPWSLFSWMQNGNNVCLTGSCETQKCNLHEQCQLLLLFTNRSFFCVSVCKYRIKIKFNVFFFPLTIS